MSAQGLDLLALGHPKWPVKDTIRVLKDCAIDTVGFFDTTFGDVRANLNKILPFVKTLRPHLWWDDNHKIVPLDVIKKRAPFYQKLAEDHLDKTIYLSHSCECDNTDPHEIQKRIDAIHQYAPSCIAVHSMGAHGIRMPNAVNEDHNPKASFQGNSYIVSTDGNNAYDMNTKAYQHTYELGLITFLHCDRFNLRQHMEAGVKPPPPKLRTAFPDYNLIVSVAALFLANRMETAPKPTFKGKIINITGTSTYKTHAEDKFGSKDPRALKPCLIVPAGQTDLEIVTWNNIHIGKLIYFGAFQNGLNRYYSGSPGGIGLYGWQIAKKATNVSGYPVVYFRDGHNFYGPVDPTFRTGSFH